MDKTALNDSIWGKGGVAPIRESEVVDRRTKDRRRIKKRGGERGGRLSGKLPGWWLGVRDPRSTLDVEGQDEDAALCWAVGDASNLSRKES